MGVVSRFRGSLSEWSGVSNARRLWNERQRSNRFPPTDHGMMVGRKEEE